MEKEALIKLITDTLTKIGLFSEAALNLLLGTCAQESAFGKYRSQLGSGIAQGIYQMEKPTFDWLKEVYEKKFDLQNVQFTDLTNDDEMATIFCRLRYYVVPAPLPDANDIPALAAYYKKWYNTPAGAATVEQFIANYNRYVA